MSSFKVVQVSDTHLSADHRFPLENWERLVRHVDALEPDLVIHTGDATLDGVSHPGQLEFAREQFRMLDAEVLVVPGNHDVGEQPANAGRLEPAVSVGSCERFASCFGQDRFVRDIGGWRLVGLNALLLGSGLDAERDLWAHMNEATAGAGGRRVAVFLHKPLFVSGPGDGSRAPHYLSEEVVERIQGSLEREGVALVASGHLHEHRILERDGVRHVWAPSTSFVTDESISSPKGTRRVGFVQHLFEPDRVTSTVVCPDDMTTHQFLDHPDFYPEFQEAARKVVEWRRSRAGADDHERSGTSRRVPR